MVNSSQVQAPQVTLQPLGWAPQLSSPKNNNCWTHHPLSHLFLDASIHVSKAALAQVTERRHFLLEAQQLILGERERKGAQVKQ